MRLVILALAFAAPAALLGGCDTEHGSGHYAEQQRPLARFDRVEVVGEFDHIRVETCDACVPNAVIRGDDNLLGEVTTTSRGSALQIATDGWLWPSLPLEVVVQGPPTTRIDVSGSAVVLVDGVDPERYDAVVGGSGEVSIAGETAHLEARVSGPGAVRAFDLVARDADVSVSGSGRVEVCAFRRLDASVSGSGVVRFDCAPQSLDRHVSGSGTIRGR